MQIQDELCKLPFARARSNLLGKDLSTFAIGGAVGVLCEPDSVEELCALMQYISLNKISYKILGAGSNVLFPDEALKDVLIRLGRGFRTLRAIGNARFIIGGAYSLMSLSRELCEAGFSGLEFAGGIPASLGGALRMNAGAHAAEICSCLETAQLVLASGEKAELTAAELNFSYRHSELPEGSVVIGAVLKLSEGDASSIALKRSDFLAERKRRQPLTLPSAGSVFKNPSLDLPAGMLIESLGLRGRRQGGAQISELHGNWIVNPTRSASAKDVVGLIELCKTKALEARKIALETELQIWG